ncbi:MAG: repeat-containing protein [Bacteroidetes bacterium]|nr:repeat-containing protein [Bacteroidota bacterium]
MVCVLSKYRYLNTTDHNQKQKIMKKLLMLFSMFSLAAFTVYGQTDDTYYQDDQATVTVKAEVAPPPIPDYVQPPCPVEGDIWTPGYWYWNGTSYSWIPGVWVTPPSVGLLWTPGYWGFYGGYYGWHRGYWGTHIGYYGGVNYGFGYYGSGFYGGRWEGGRFMYNTAVWHVGRGVHNVYVDHTVVNNHVVNHASFNGPGGVKYRPSNTEVGGMHENHIEPAQNHVAHERNMSTEKGQFHSPTTRPAVHSMSAPGGQRFNQGGHAIHMGGGGGGHMGGGHAGGGGHGGGRH